MIVPRSMIEAYDNKIRDKNDQITRLARDNIDLSRMSAAKDGVIDRWKKNAGAWKRSQTRYFGLCLLFMLTTLVLGLLLMDAHRKIDTLKGCWPVVQDPAQMKLPPTVISMPVPQQVTTL